MCLMIRAFKNVRRNKINFSCIKVLSREQISRKLNLITTFPSILPGSLHDEVRRSGRLVVDSGLRQPDRHHCRRIQIGHESSKRRPSLYCGYTGRITFVYMSKAIKGFRYFRKCPIPAIACDIYIFFQFTHTVTFLMKWHDWKHFRLNLQHFYLLTVF